MRFSFLLFLTLLLSCGPEKKSPGPNKAERACAYNDRITGLQSRLDSASRDLAFSFRARNSSASIKAVEKLKAQINMVIDTLNSWPDFEGDSSLRKAAIDLFGVYLNDANKVRSVIAVLDKPESDTVFVSDSIPLADSLDPDLAMISFYENAVRRNKKDQEIFDHFFIVQEEFARKHEFQLARKSSR